MLSVLLVSLVGSAQAEPPAGNPESAPPPPTSAPADPPPAPAPAEDALAPAMLRAGWSKLLLEEALRSVESPAKPFDFLCESLDADDLRPERIAFAASGREVSRAAAEDYDRVRLYAEGVYLFRHPRWYDARFRLRSSEEAAGRPRALEVQAVPTVAGGKPLIRVSALRVPLVELLRQIGGATGERYEVSGRLGERKVTASLTLVTPETVRALLVVLYPDAAWHAQADGTWSLREQPNADLIYVAAQTAGEREGPVARARGAIHVQLIASLTPEQLLKLERTGRFQRRWAELDPVLRELVLLCGEVFLRTIRESGGDPDQFLDLDRTTDLAVDLARSRAALELRLIGRGGDGALVAW